MDEVDFGIAYHKLVTLAGHADDPDIGPQNIRNALIVVAAMLDGLNQRITEMQETEDE